MADYAQDASNKVMSARQCLNAANIIVVAILLAHFVDRLFYTLKDAATDADHTIAYFAIGFNVCFIIGITVVFYRIPRIVRSEPALMLNTRLVAVHIAALSLFFSFWAIYMTAYEVWMADPKSY